MEINFFNSIAYPREHLIGYCVEYIAQYCYRQMLAEDLYRIAFLAVDVSDVNHCHIHADIAHGWRFLASDETIGVASSEVSVEAVGISYRYGGDDAVACEYALAAISHGFLFRHMA